MRKKRLTKRANQRNFARTAKRVHKKNIVATHKRGGIRL